MSLDFYDRHFLQLMLLSGEDTLAAQRDFIVQALNLQAGQSLLDQGCGIGRLSWALAAQGLKVTGLDQSAHYIQRAQAGYDTKQNTHSEAAQPPQFIQGDARYFQSPVVLDAILSWHTSFGHHRERDENKVLLANGVKQLKPGGQYLLDYANFDYTRAHFQPEFEQNYALAEGQLKVLRHSHFNERDGLFEQNWKFVYPNGEIFERQGSIQSYSPAELTQLFEAVGLKIQRTFGAADGRPQSPTAPRWIAVAHKEAQ